MLVRIRLKTGPRIQQREHDLTRRLALGFAALLTPAALIAAVLALWRLGADMDWAGEFAIPAGWFSHWQVWVAVAVALQVMAMKLNDWGRGSRRR